MLPMPPRLHRAQGGRWRTDFAWALAVLMGLLLPWEAAGLDLPLQRLVGGSQGFAWSGAWFTRTLLHDGGRWLAGAALLYALLAWARPPRGGPSRARWGLAVASTLACLVLVPGLKRFSQTSCPWNLAEFGGTVPHVPHWLLGVADGGPGHCFPSGHAVSAFAFFSLYFAWRSHHPGRARAWLAAVLGFGALFAWAQYARGAHFVSHSLWSAWLCWVLCAGLAAAGSARPARLGAQAC